VQYVTRKETHVCAFGASCPLCVIDCGRTSIAAGDINLQARAVCAAPKADNSVSGARSKIKDSKRPIPNGLRKRLHLTPEDVSAAAPEVYASQTAQRVLMAIGIEVKLIHPFGLPPALRNQKRHDGFLFHEFPFVF
jgi:hypothetical protein